MNDSWPDWKWSPIRLSVIAVAAIVLLPACGDERDPEQDRREIRTSLATLVRLAEARDAAGVCKWLAPVAQRQLGSVGHVTPTTCRPDTARFFEEIDKDPNTRSVDPRITRIELDGDRAKAVADYGGGQAGALVFRRHDGRWKLATVYSVTRSAPDALGTPVRGLPSVGVATTMGPRPTTRPVTASAGGKPCPAVSVEETEVRGGCRLSIREARLALRLRSPLGDTPFATCIADLDLHVADDGEATVDVGRVDVALPGPGGPCGDITSCYSLGGDPNNVYNVPWRGRIRARSDGSMVAEIEACFDSCAGRLQGLLTVPMSRAQRGWRLRADSAPIGRSGLSVSGDWTLAPGRLQLARAASERPSG